MKILITLTTLGPHTNGSQFAISLRPLPFLQNRKVSNKPSDPIAHLLPSRTCETIRNSSDNSYSSFLNNL